MLKDYQVHVSIKTSDRSEVEELKNLLNEKGHCWTNGHLLSGDVVTEVDAQMTRDFSDEAEIMAYRQELEKRLKNKVGVDIYIGTG